MNSSTLSHIWQSVTRGNKIALTALGKLLGEPFMNSAQYTVSLSGLGDFDVTITEINTNKAFVIFDTMVHGDAGGANNQVVNWYFLNSTTVRFNSNSSNPLGTVRFTVISW